MPASVRRAPGGPFPPTRQSVVAAAQSADTGTRRAAFDVLVASYWKPVYKYLRLQWHAGESEAEDLTQEFFARAFEKGFFDRYDPAQSRFRTYLRVCLDGLVANERKSASRLKRGGGVPHLSLDFKTAEGEVATLEPATDDNLDAFFHREWVRSLLELAVEDLRVRSERDGKALHFAVFRRYDLEGPDAGSSLTYKQLAEELAISPSDVTNYLAWARREFRASVLERLRAVCGSEEEFLEEARQLVGGWSE